MDVGPAGTQSVMRRNLAWDGIISHVLQPARGWKRMLQRSETKLVAFASMVPQSLGNLPSVRIDDAKVAQAIGRHLLAGGFRRLAYYRSSSDWVNDHRAAGLKAFADAEGCECIINLRTEESPIDIRMPALVQWIRKLHKPVGIVAWNMDVARKIVEACQRAKLSIPEEVAVVAWNDDPLVAETDEPTISAVVLPAERLGYEAARLLDQLLQGKVPSSSPVLIEPSGIMHVRQSSDAASLRDRDVYLASQYIREHATEPLRVSHLVEALRVSRRKLEQSFRRVTGDTLHEAITRVRIERAKQLLLETDWTQERIAQRCGLGTKRSLRINFQRDQGMTPGQYRIRFGRGGARTAHAAQSGSLS
jgi:LacI family transcriptional regulator